MSNFTFISTLKYLSERVLNCKNIGTKNKFKNETNFIVTILIHPTIFILKSDKILKNLLL